MAATVFRGNSRHLIAHNTLVAPEDLPRYAEMGVMANCTPLWGTDYHGQYRTIYTELLGAERVEERRDLLGWLFLDGVAGVQLVDRADDEQVGPVNVAEAV